MKSTLENNCKIYSPDKTPLPGLSFSDHRKRISELMIWLEEKGFDLKNSRISIYQEFLNNFQHDENFNPATNDEDHKNLDQLLYVLREVHELMWIQKGLKILEPKGLDDKLKSIIGGSPFARDDIDTSSRNYQFELRIASYFLQKNYAVDLSNITDIIATKGETEFHIECKRIYSEKKTLKRAKEAAKQLKERLKTSRLKSNKFGVAVFDVTKIAFPHQGLTWGVSDEHCKDVIRSKLIEIVEQYDVKEPFYSIKNMVGVWSQIHIPSLNIGLNHPTTRFSSNFAVLAKNSGASRKAFEQFQEVYEVTDTIP